MLRSLLTQSFNIVNTPIILLFSKKWVPGFAAEDNSKILICTTLNITSSDLAKHDLWKVYIHHNDPNPDYLRTLLLPPWFPQT